MDDRTLMYRTIGIVLGFGFALALIAAAFGL